MFKQVIILILTIAVGVLMYHEDECKDTTKICESYSSLLLIESALDVKKFTSYDYNVLKVYLDSNHCNNKCPLLCSTTLQCGNALTTFDRTIQNKTFRLELQKVISSLQGDQLSSLQEEYIILNSIIESY